MNIKKICVLIVLIFFVIAYILIGPADIFSHGHYVDEINYQQIPAEDWGELYQLGENNYEMEFSPQDKHFAGFEIYLVNQAEGNTGKLTLTISNSAGEPLDKVEIELKKITTESWYKVNTNANLKKGQVYGLKFEVTDCNAFPYLQAVNNNYLKAETVSGNILLSYAYARSTFNVQMKIIILIFLLSISAFLCTFIVGKNKKKLVNSAAIIMFMIGVLTMNYMYNVMDKTNTTFNDYQEDSDTLVTSVIYAKNDGIKLTRSNTLGYGLGRFCNLKGALSSYNTTYITDDNYLEGYSRSGNSIIADSNIFSNDVARIGNYIMFANGDKYEIINLEYIDTNMIIYLNTEKPLSSVKNGSLDSAQFIDANERPLGKSLFAPYISQYGLHGKIYGFLGDYIGITTLRLLTSIMVATILTLIIFLIYNKYGMVMASCYFAVFWLSPWIVNFARNLYWVEFTWFLPMLIGLLCSIKIENRLIRILSYIATFITILVKCLCGYEYISSIMMGLIGFLLVDLVKSMFEKDKRKSLLLLRTIVIIGVAALAAFLFAILLHAQLRGNGNIVEGIKRIIDQDVLRRTVGGDLNQYRKVHWNTFNASIWDTVQKYLYFSTDIILGIPGKFFLLLSALPLFIFIFDFVKNKIHIEEIALYVVFFLTSVSWFCLAKAHSYVHTHMNYVLWYFGFVQICIYVIVNRIIGFIKERGESK